MGRNECYHDWTDSRPKRGSGESMRCRVLTAAPVVLAGAFAASVALAAAPTIASGPGAARAFAASQSPTLGEALPANFALGGINVLPAAQAGSLGSSNSVALNLGTGVRIDLSRGPNRDAFGSLFPSTSTLNTAYLSGASPS